jgi:hypothetical protein
MIEFMHNNNIISLAVNVDYLGESLRCDVSQKVRLAWISSIWIFLGNSSEVSWVVLEFNYYLITHLFDEFRVA